MHVSRFWVALLFPAVLMVLFARVSPCENHKHGGAEVTSEAPLSATQTVCPNNWSSVTCCVPPSQQENSKLAKAIQAPSSSFGTGHHAQHRWERSQRPPCVEEQPASVQYTCRLSTPAAGAAGAVHHHSYGASVQQNAPEKQTSGDKSATHSHSPNKRETPKPANGAVVTGAPDAGEKSEKSAAGPSTAAVGAMVPVMAILASVLA